LQLAHATMRCKWSLTHVLATLGAVCLSIPILKAPAKAADLTLDQALALARRANPELQAVARELMIASGEIMRARYLSQFNPLLTSDGDYRMRDGNANSQDWRVGLSQELEVFGQRELRKKAATLNYAEKQSWLTDRRRLLDSAVALTFYEALRAHARLGVFEELRELDSALLKAAEARMAAGDINQIALNLARIRHGQAQHALVEQQARYQLVCSSLGRLLGGQAGAEPQPRGSLAVDNTEVSLRSLLESARRRRPDLMARELALSRLQTELALNRKLALPNPTVGLFGGHELNAEHFVGISLSFPLPFFDRRQAEATILAGQTAQAKDQLRATELDVARQVRDAYRSFVTARETLAIYDEEVVEPARQSAALLQRAFTSGKIDLFEVALAERQVFDARLGYLDASFNLRAAALALRMAAGGHV
jgi:cobalt-zinc-cadmium efflux system outer membrane protein